MMSSVQLARTYLVVVWVGGFFYTETFNITRRSLQCQHVVIVRRFSATDFQEVCFCNIQGWVCCSLCLVATKRWTLHRSERIAVELWRRQYLFLCLCAAARFRVGVFGGTEGRREGGAYGLVEDDVRDPELLSCRFQSGRWAELIWLSILSVKIFNRCCTCAHLLYRRFSLVFLAALHAD